MGNKISCSCAPLIKRAYRYEDSPWAVTRRREGHLLRLWAEVFHVSSTGSGQFKWQQVSEDLVPVNITCIQDSPDAIFHITAYNPQVDKILDVRLVQPGTKIGQASECFVYWKDPMTGDTWGLNFTSPLDARQFRECCSPSFKFSRKASSSYSLKMEAPRHRKNSSRRHAQSTPSSPSKAGLDREPQCTCMTPEQQARYRAAQGFHSMSHRTLPLAPRSQIMADYYDQLDHRSGSRMSLDHEMDRRRGNGLQRRELTATKSVDYSEMESVREGFQSRRNKSKSTDDVSQLRFDSNTLKRMLQPMGSLDSPVTSPECPRRGSAQRPSRLDGFLSEPESSLARMKRESSFLDSNCYATTPSSSNGGGNSDAENPLGSPNAKLLKEYEAHLRSTLAQGLEAESISLNTFEALISQSMDNLAQSCRSLPSTSASARRTPRPMSAGPLRYPSGQRLDRGYVSDHWDSSRMSSFEDSQHRRSGYGSDLRGSGYLSDHRPLLSTSRDLSHQPSSVESTDSRICYLTSSEISDDERLSLTTALSDDEDMGNPMGNRSGIPAASFSCTGAVRKAGFLSVKKWLLRKKHRIELARKRGWKGYWVCLKGTTMLFYPCDSSEDSNNEAGQRGNNVEASPRHLIIVDGAILQPIPEHPKREYIFCLSTAFGDAYLFQAPCQVELENWIQSIHGACAAAFARHRGKTGTLHLLKEEVLRLEKAIESDRKLKHMAELQLSVVSDADSKYQIQSQINQWEENLERLRCEQFRLRCYMASLEGSELPNPKNLLTNVSRGTKLTLNRLGVFTVSSLHAYICARSPSLLSNLLAGRGATKRRPYVHTLSRSNSGSSKRSFQIEPGESSVGKTSFKVYTVPLPNNQEVSVNLKEAMSVEEFLASACLKKGLSPQEHFVRIKKRRDMDDNNSFIPHRSDLIDSYLATHEVVEICAKIIYQVDLSRNSLTQMWGFSVEAELVENSEKQDELCCYISRAEEGSLAMSNGLMKGDEILVINGAVVGDLDMMYLEALLQEERTLSLVIRSARRGPPNNGRLRSSDYIMSLVCPPPPSEPPTLSEEAICGLIVPAPTEKSNELTGIGCPPPPVDGRRLTQRSSSLEIENLLKSAEQVTGICRKDEGLEGGSSLLVGGDLSPTTSLASSSFSHSLTPQRQLSDAVRLRKVILELLETEKTYVSHLNSLLENYLEPLKRETFLSATEITGLFGNILEIVMFQRLFARGMEEAIHVDGDIFAFDQPPQFKNVLFALGNAFLFHSKNFKLYSSFCASHSKAQKILHPHEGNQALQRFLRLRNPRGQHSMSLESYLIKPIQRILQYPLLLTQLQQLTPVGSEEHQHLGEALREMEGVAEHINEMQRIHEEYGAIFDHLCRQHLKNYKQEMDLSPGELLYYGGVEWLNIGEFLGRGKKGLEFHSMCFVFCTAVVFLCKERLRQKKKLMGPPSRMPGGVNSEVEVIRYQVLIPVNQVQVRCPNVKEVEARFYWELIHLRGGGNSSQPNNVQRRNEKAYHLCNSTSEFRNAFIKTIRQIIRESVRNMSIPSNKAELIRGSKEHRDAMLSRTLSTRASSTSGERREKSHSNGERRDSRGSQTRSQTLSTRGSRESPNFRARSMTEGTAGRKPELTLEPTSSLDYSEGEGSGEKPALGKTPKHLSLSSTSTLSISSSAGLGQAKLIHSSGTPGNQNNEGSSKPMGSPVWKPRDPTVEAFPLPPGKDS